MTALRKPRFTDNHRWQFGPYVDAKASQEPNYLRDRFAAIREQQTRDAAEAKIKVSPISKSKSGGR